MSTPETTGAVARCMVALEKFVPLYRLNRRARTDIAKISLAGNCYFVLKDGRWSSTNVHVHSYRYGSEGHGYHSRVGNYMNALHGLAALGVVSIDDVMVVSKLRIARKQQEDTRVEMKRLRRTAKRLGFKLVKRAERRSRAGLVVKGGPS